MSTATEETGSTWLRVGDVAEVLGVSANTVRRWTDAGRIAAHRSPGGHRRYLADDVRALLPAEEGGEGGAQPGDFAQLRREAQGLRTTLHAGLDLLPLLADDPHAVPEQAARTLCAVTGAARCDVYAGDAGTLRLTVSIEGDALATERDGALVRTADWAPVDGDPASAPVTCLRAGAPGLGRRDRQALRRRGCAALAWAPLVVHGELAGAVELSDAGDRDFSRHAEVLDGVARVCSEALALQRTFDELAARDGSVHQLVDLSREVAQSHDFERFVLRFAQRLLAATGAACVDVWRVTGGVIRAVVSCTRDGADASLRDKLLDTSRYPSLERTLLDHTPLAIADTRDPRLAPAEVELYRQWGFASSLTMPLVAGGELVGLVDIYDGAERDWGPELEILTGSCQLVAGVFDSTALLGEAREIARLREEVVVLGAELAEAETTQDIAELAAARLRAATGCADCDVWWLQEGFIRCLASVDGDGLDEEARGRVLRADRYPSTKQAIEERQLLIITSLADERLTEEERENYAEWAFHSIASVPLVSSDRVVGLIDLYDGRERDFNEIRWFLPDAARTVADALRNAELLDGLRRGNAALRELVELGDRLNEAGTLEDLARAVAERLRALLSAEDCDIWQVDGDVLRCLASVDSRGWDADEVGTECILTQYESTVRALDADEPEVIGDLEAAEIGEVELESYRSWGYRSVVSLPLVVEGRPIGLIDVFDTKVRDFTVHLDLIRSVGRLLAGSFEKAMLVERLGRSNENLRQAARETRLLNEIATRTAASLDLEEVVKAAVDELGQLLAFDEYALLLLEGAAIGRVIASRPEADQLVGLVPGAFVPGIAERLAAEAVLVLRLPDDLPGLADFPALDGLSSGVVIALPSDTGLLGVLGLTSAGPDAFATADRHLLERVGTQLSLAITNAQLYDEIKQMHLGNLKALSSALNAKDYYTLGHAARVAAYSVMLGRRLGWPEELLAPLEEAAYLHDIGKISISDRVLLKPSRLNQQEWEQMRQHPVVSADIIRPLFPPELVLAVRHHHERFDGRGYPDGLAGGAIPPLARAMAVVDAYDAMSCRRPYKAGLTYAECLAELHECRGTQFDPAMVDAFLHVLEDIALRRTRADEIAAAAAGRIRGDTHRALMALDDEESNAYREVEEVLREVRDANPPTRFLTTHAMVDKRYVIGVDPEEDPAQRSHLGDEIFVDEELQLVLAGERPQVNTVFADEFGVWVTGLAPVRDSAGDIVAVTVADTPALSVGESEALRSDGRQTFAAMLQTAAVRLSRAEIDAITDALTGLYNHRYLHERLSEELHRARELQRPLSVLFCDLDHFKSYNDTNGHSAGDAVLREVGHVIEQSVRNVDVAARYGGEEFVVILVETDRVEARRVAERIRARLKDAGFTAGGTALTVSIGIAGYPDDADRREDLLNKADRAMYLAKRHGRDQVAAFGEG